MQIERGEGGVRNLLAVRIVLDLLLAAGGDMSALCFCVNALRSASHTLDPTPPVNPKPEANPADRERSSLTTYWSESTSSR